MTLRSAMNAVFALFAAVAPLLATAATYQVDDRASAPYESTSRLEWDSVVPGRGTRPTVSGRAIVRVRLDLRAWQRRSANVYLRLQNTSFGPVSASWTTHGRLLPGNVRSGERALVYSGPIRSDLIDDELALAIQADGRQLVRKESLNFSFEIDVN